MTIDENSGNVSYELCKKADELLKQNGLEIWGQEKSDNDYCQNRFERRVQLGAFSRNSKRRR